VSARASARVALIGALSCAACEGPAQTPRDAQAAIDASVPSDAGAPAQILEVFFGLDNALPATANLLCAGAGGLDGMPVTFSRRIGVDAPEAAAFRVTTRSGQARTPRCATLRPALGPSKRHTVLLIGDFGDDPGDPPARVEVVGSVPLLNGGDARGASSDRVTPLSQGPELRIALRYAPAALAGSSCPMGTRQIVQLTWAGGVRGAAGGELGDDARAQTRVTLSTGDVVTPVALADLGDNDNYTQLCLDTDTPAESVTVEAGVAIDPRGDANPRTSARVTTDPEGVR
jgi:hypothetical protein